MIKKRFYSNGKILLTGEYAVMFGAKSLAFPLIYGQEMEVEPVDGSRIYWEAYAEQELWFKVIYALPDFSIIETTDSDKAQFLQKILQYLFSLNKKLFDTDNFIRTKTNFPINWGFGTSSTLIHNLALWAKTDPYHFFYNVSKGSGYDIACAASKTPVLFQRKNKNPQVIPVQFRKSYLSNLYLVYSGKKKATEQHLAMFLQKTTKLKNEVERISKITDEILHTDNLEKFIELILIHEELIGQLLQKKTIQKELFADFDGGIKSLGAWGGDFFLAASAKGKEYIQQYFEHFNLSVILPFEKTILSSSDNI